MNDASPSFASTTLDQPAIRRIVIGVMVALLLAAIDQTIVAPALPTIGRELGDIEHLPWVVTAYLLSATAVTPLYGKLADIHGRRAMLLVGIGIFLVGSLACALAPTMLALILARAVQGVGGGALISLAQTIIGDIIPPKERGRYQAYFAAVFITASLVGPVFGGFFSEHLHWSMIFWINLPIGAVALFMTWGVLKRLPRHERPHKLDVTGAALMVIASVALMLALTWGGVLYPWTSAPILGLFAASAVVWVFFAMRLLTATEPFVPLAVLSNPIVRACTAAGFFGVGAIIGLSIYLPVYFEAVVGLTSSQSGLALLPFVFGGVTGANISGWIMFKSPRYKRPAIIGVASGTIALVVLALFPTHLPFWGVELLLAVVGVGTGTIYPVNTVAIQNAVDLHQLGTATAALNFLRSLGGALIVAVFGAILLGGLGASAASGSVTTMIAEATRNGADVSHVFGMVFGAAALGFVATLIALIVMEERPLRGTVGM